MASPKKKIPAKKSPASRQLKKPTKAKKLARLADGYEQSRAVTDAKLNEIARTLQVFWSNQRELSKSAGRLDEQFCVLGRLSISMLNTILVRIGADNEIIDGHKLDQLFKEWAAFRSRPDFRDLMLEWLTGVALTELPALPDKKEEPADTSATAAPQAQEFGGDYGESSEDGNAAAAQEPPGEAPSEAAPVS